jgi:hypothetical protein
MVRAFDLIIQSLIIRGLRPSLQRLDNEASLALRNYLTKQGIDYQLAHPHIQRLKNSERAIQTFKNHFIAGPSSVDPNFPLKLWDKLLPKATITLNLLRKPRISPRMSAYAQLNGHFDFNRTPMAPLAPASLYTRNQINGPHGIIKELMATNLVQHWNTTDINKFISQKQKGCKYLTLWSFFLQRQQCQKHHQMIWPPLQPWNCPMPFRTHPLWLLSVTLTLQNSKH